MQLLWLLALVATVAVAEQLPAQAVVGAELRVGLALAAMGCVVGFAFVAVSQLIGELQYRRGTAAALRERLRLLERLHLGFWCTVTLATLYPLRWTQLVRMNLGLDDCLIVRDLVLFVPVWLPWLGSWLAFGQLDWALAQSAASFVPTDRGEHLRRFVLCRLKFYGGLLLFPAVLALTVYDLADTAAGGLSARPENTALGVVACLVVVALGMPFLARCWWRASPLPAGPLRSRLEAANRQFGLGLRDILVWETHGQVVNAAVAGWLPGWRLVFVTDALLARLDADEVYAVVLHEAGHIRRRHLPLRMLTLVIPLWLAVLMQSTDDRFAANSASPLLPGLVLPVVLVATIALLLGWYSRLLEHDADLWAWAALASGPAGPLASTRPTEAQWLARALRKMTPASRAAARAWLHPTLAARLAVLQQAACDTQLVARWHHRTLVIAGALLCGGILATCLRAWWL